MSDGRLRKRRTGGVNGDLLYFDDEAAQYSEDVSSPNGGPSQQFLVQTPPSSLNLLSGAAPSSPQWTGKYTKIKRHRRHRRSRKPKIVNTILAGVCATLVSGSLSLLLLPRLTDAQTTYLRSLLGLLTTTTTATKKTMDFLCSDGVTRGALDDDYCDCPDGGDEPRTSACAGVAIVAEKTFACRDGVRRIFASRVGDGIRDCPDGSDEVLS